MMSSNRTTRLPRRGLQITFRKKKPPYNNMYGHMFIQDLCMDFSISLSPSFRSDDFFEIKPNDSHLGGLLNYKRARFLDYDFTQLLSGNMHELIRYGRCSVEVALVVDQEKLIGIQFKPIYANLCFREKHTTTFYEQNHSGEYIKKTLENRLVIELDLKHLNLKRNYFRKIVNGLSAMELPDYEELNKREISFSDFTGQQKLDAYKLINKAYWNMRDNSDEYCTEAYLLYRKVKYKELQFRLLEYLLSKYNQALEGIGREYHFSGEIHPNKEVLNSRDALNSALTDEMDLKKIREVLFPKQQ